MESAIPMDDAFWTKVARARSLTEEERFYETIALIDRTREMMAAGVRLQFPEAGDAEVAAIVSERLWLARRLESMP